MKNNIQIIFFLIIVFLAIYIYAKHQQEKLVKDNEATPVEYYNPPTQTTTYQDTTRKTQYRKRELIPKEKRELEEKSQYEFDVKEEAYVQMDERGIDEDY